VDVGHHPRAGRAWGVRAVPGANGCEVCEAGVGRSSRVGACKGLLHTNDIYALLKRHL
jgi:hypothetical protein